MGKPDPFLGTSFGIKSTSAQAIPAHGVNNLNCERLGNWLHQHVERVHLGLGKIAIGNLRLLVVDRNGFGHEIPCLVGKKPSTCCHVYPWWFSKSLHKSLTYQNIFWGHVRKIDPSYQASRISHKTHHFTNLRFLASASPIFSICSLNSVLSLHLRWYEIEFALDLLFFGLTWLHSW